MPMDGMFASEKKSKVISDAFNSGSWAGGREGPVADVSIMCHSGVGGIAVGGLEAGSWFVAGGAWMAGRGVDPLWGALVLLLLKLFCRYDQPVSSSD